MNSKVELEQTIKQVTILLESDLELALPITQSLFTISNEFPNLSGAALVFALRSTHFLAYSEFHIEQAFNQSTRLYEVVKTTKNPLDKVSWNKVVTSNGYDFFPNQESALSQGILLKFGWLIMNWRVLQKP